MSDNEKLVSVGRFGTSVEAHLARNRLEEAGIPAVVTGEEVGSALPMTMGLSAIEVQVRESDLFRASAVLDDIDEAEPVPEHGIQTPGRLTTGPVLPSEDETLASEDEPPRNAREDAAQRAYRGAILGLIFCPLQIYVSWLLLQVFLSEEELQPEVRRRAVLAAVINAPFLLGFCLILRAIVGEWLR